MPGGDPSGSSGGGGAQTAGLAATGLNSDQQAFAVELASKTGLSVGVIAAWELAEESGSAANSYSSEGFEDWLNIGGVGAAGGKSFAGFHSTPVVAADDTAAWMAGKLSIPGFGSASPGIQKITKAGNDPSADIAAINSSGWDGSAGYSDLQSLYAQVTKAGGSELVPGGVVPAAGNAISSAANSVAGAVTGPVQAVEQVWSAITNPSNWLRALEVLGAVVAIYLAVKSLTGQDPAAVVNSAPVQAVTTTSRKERRPAQAPAAAPAKKAAKTARRAKEVDAAETVGEAAA